MEYDYIIIGAGPSGLTLAYILGCINKKCLLIDSNSDIGGCHRVIRVNNLFSEHSPRVYSNSYLNFIQLLKHMNCNFTDLFTPYNFNISRISGETILKSLNFKEKIKLLFEFIKLIIKKEFMENRNFTNETKDYIDRLCRLTDGASSDRYSLNKFFQLANQQIFHKIYQPKQPHDVGLFRLWKDKLYRNDIDILLNTEIICLDGKDESTVETITVKENTLKNCFEIKAKKYIFCIPPKHLGIILSKKTSSGISYKNAFGNFNTVNEWINSTNYMNYIPITFHWDYTHKNVILPKVWGFPNTEWGIAFIVLSNYMNFNDKRSIIVISTCITKNIKSTYINKTPDECSENELKRETLRQLLISFPELPNPSYAIIHPNVKYINNKWIEDDTAFISATNTKYLKYNSDTVVNMFQVGTQNGNSKYRFTTMESAISNGIVFSNYIEKNTQKIIKTTNTVDLVFVIKFFIFLIFLIFIFTYLRYSQKKVRS